MSKLLQLQNKVKEQPLAAVSLIVGFCCSVFVFLQVQPELILSNTTPAGGDMGAHVWGPAFLRDHLLPSFRLSGWTPDWYAGFPAFHFYMVVPALAIVLLNAGLTPILGVFVAAAVLYVGYRLAQRVERYRPLVYALTVLVALGMISLPYGISFKIISVTGIVLMPLCGWAMGKLANTPEPIPGALALGVTVFLFDTNFTIYGGNILSTLAGEFAFSISLALAILAIGVAARGMETNSHRAIGAVVISLVALNHVIPLIFAVVALALLVLLDDSTPRLWILGLALTLFVGVWMSDWTISRVTISGLVSFMIVVGAIVAADANVQKRFYWLLVVGPVAALLAMFWLLPFQMQSEQFNDMGWERLNETVPALLTTPMKVALPVAVIGAIFAVATKDRIGMLFTLMGILSAAGVLNLPHGRLWNARLLPFYYLSVYLLAAVGIGYVIRFVGSALSESYGEPQKSWIGSALVLGLVAVLIGISIPLRNIPFGRSGVDGTYSWMGLENSAGSPIPGWSRWNYSGYEQKNSYREYRDIVATMGDLGESNGCGRAMWEYHPDLDRYGTPMALMLMPLWTDGCIGSMEGLYFESSATTPFHFLNQSTLSESPSRAQRDLPYKGFDINLGINQLQTMGVRYYMAQTDMAIEAAENHPELTRVATSEPWAVYEVASSELVSALAFEPVVASGPPALEDTEVSRFDQGWVSTAVDYYNSMDRYNSIPAVDGPADWERVQTLETDGGTPLSPVTVSNIKADTDSISFSVDQVGTPVLVKVSYFPNWKATGADGPWQAGPNLMVVVPTSTDVKLSYGRTGWDWAGYLLTLLGIAALAGLANADRRARRGPTFAGSSGGVDRGLIDKLDIIDESDPMITVTKFNFNDNDNDNDNDNHTDTETLAGSEAVAEAEPSDGVPDYLDPLEMPEAESPEPKVAPYDEV